MTRYLALVMLTALFVPACGSSQPKVPPAPPYRNPLDQLPREVKQPDIPPPKLGTGKAFSDEEKAFMNEAFLVLRLTIQTPDDPRLRGKEPWPDLRARWLKMGKPAVNTLVENLFAYMLKAQRTQPGVARRVQAEMVDLSEQTMPYLLLTLQMKDFKDRTGAKQRIDEITRKTAAETLGLMGSPVVDPLLRGLPRMPAASRRVVAQAMANLLDPRVTKTLIGLLDDPSYMVGAEAAMALRAHEGPDVTPALLRVYGDPKRDRLVREKAGTMLNVRRDPAAVPELVKILEQALAADDAALLTATTRILRRTTGQSLTTDPKAWRAYLRREKE
jgi:HEAT repeats